MRAVRVVLMLIGLSLLSFGSMSPQANAMVDVRERGMQAHAAERASVVVAARERNFAVGDPPFSDTYIAVAGDAGRSTGDLWLALAIGVGLVAYQLCRKHRLLRPHPFGN